MVIDRKSNRRSLPRLLLQTLRVFKEDEDATATGLLQQKTNLKFLGTVYLLREVLPILDHLSKTFQQGEVCLASIAPAIEYRPDQQREICLTVRDFRDAKYPSCLLTWRNTLRATDQKYQESEDKIVISYFSFFPYLQKSHL